MAVSFLWRNPSVETMISCFRKIISSYRIVVEKYFQEKDVLVHLPKELRVFPSRGIKTMENKKVFPPREVKTMENKKVFPDLQ